MKGLFYLEGCSNAGSERVLQDIADDVTRAGMDIAVASCGPRVSPIGTRWRNRGTRYEWMRADVSPQRLSSATVPRGFAEWWRALLDDVSPDVILANNGGYPWHATCLAATRVAHAVEGTGRTRRYLAIHSTPEAVAEDAAETAADRAVARSCDAIVVGSTNVRQQIAAARPALASRLTTINYGVADPGTDDKPQRRVPVTFGMAGDFRGLRKGQLDFVRALATLPGAIARWRAVVAGDGPGLEAARAAAVGLPVEFAGRVPFERMDRFYRGLDVYVLPSLQEGLSLTVLEAMAHGLPIVASDVGGHAEAVTHGETGFLVPPGDTAALGTALQTLLREPSLRAAMGERARVRYADLFTKTRALRRWRCLLFGDSQ